MNFMIFSMRQLSKQVLLFLFFLISIPCISQSDIDQQLKINDSKAEAFIREGEENAAAQLYNQSAYLLRSINRLDEAIDYYEKVLDINTRLGNRRGQMISYNSLATRPVRVP